MSLLSVKKKSNSGSDKCIIFSKLCTTERKRDTKSKSSNLIVIVSTIIAIDVTVVAVATHHYLSLLQSSGHRTGQKGQRQCIASVRPVTPRQMVQELLVYPLSVIFPACNCQRRPCPYSTEWVYLTGH